MSRNRISKLIFTLVFIVTYNTSIQAQTGLEIMKKNDEQQTTKSESVKLTMLLINKSGKKRTRSVQRYSVTDQNNNRSSLILFHYPADVKGTGYLELEHPDKDNDGWLYLPALKRSRRISTADESDNFMSSEFTYEDLNDEDLEEHSYTLVGSEIIDGTDCFHVVAEPATDKKIKESGYSKRDLYISKENYIAIKINYYNKSGSLMKQFFAGEIRQVENTNKWRAHKMTMNNLKTQASTVLEFEDFILNQGIDSEVFTIRYMENNN